MKRLSALFLSIAVPAVLLLSAGCSVPHRIVSKEDVTARAWNDPASDKAVLIASRSSEFKDRIVEAVEQGVRRDDVYVKVIGVEELENEDGGTYTAVVLINTCMAWAMAIRHSTSSTSRISAKSSRHSPAANGPTTRGI